MSFSPRIILSQRWHSGRNANAEFLSVSSSGKYVPDFDPSLARANGENQPDRTKTPSGRPRESRSLQEYRRHVSCVVTIARTRLPARNGTTTRWEDRTEPPVSRQSFESAIRARCPVLQPHPCGLRNHATHTVRTIHKRSDRVNLPWWKYSPMSSRNVDRFLERRKLMILAVVARVWDVLVATVESVCTSRQGIWAGKEKKPTRKHHSRSPPLP